MVGSLTMAWLTTEADNLSSLHCAVMSTGVMSDHIGHRDAIAVEVDAQRRQRAQANLDGLRCSEACCELPLYSEEKEALHWRPPVAMKPAWVASSLKSGA